MSGGSTARENATEDSCILRWPESPAEWDAYHSIRRRAIFEAYLPEIEYDPNHPDERGPDRHSLVLFNDGSVIGTVRIDLIDEARAALRLVAIDPSRQREGHGSTLLGLAEDFIRSQGRRRIVLHGNPETVGFYFAHGYAESPWLDDASTAGAHIDVAKDL